MKSWLVNDGLFVMAYYILLWLLCWYNQISSFPISLHHANISQGFFSSLLEGEQFEMGVEVSKLSKIQRQNGKWPGAFVSFPYVYMGVSENSGTPKWMVYNGKPYYNGWFGGTTIFGNIHIHIYIYIYYAYCFFVFKRGWIFTDLTCATVWYKFRMFFCYRFPICHGTR